MSGTAAAQPEWAEVAEPLSPSQEAWLLLQVTLAGMAIPPTGQEAQGAGWQLGGLLGHKPFCPWVPHHRATASPKGSPLSLIYSWTGHSSASGPCGPMVLEAKEEAGTGQKRSGGVRMPR